MIELRWVKTNGGAHCVLEYRYTWAVDASGAICPGIPGEWTVVEMVDEEDQNDDL